MKVKAKIFSGASQEGQYGDFDCVYGCSLTEDFWSDHTNPQMKIYLCRDKFWIGSMFRRIYAVAVYLEVTVGIPFSFNLRTDHHMTVHLGPFPAISIEGRDGTKPYAYIINEEKGQLVLNRINEKTQAIVERIAGPVPKETMSAPFSTLFGDKQTVESLKTSEITECDQKRPASP